MSIIVDVVFTVVLAMSSTIDGKDVIQHAPFTFDTRAACMSFRGERLDAAADLVKKVENAKITFYISECTAIPVTKAAE